MALILNLETATDIGSVCISKGLEILGIKESSETFAHASETTLLIEAVLQETGYSLQEIDAIAVSAGPGSYTALRVGTSVAKGIGYALDKPLIAISTLQWLAAASAQKHPQATFYIPMIDARRMEVYTAIFDSEGKEVKAPTPVILHESTFDDYLKGNQPIVCSGSGSFKFKDIVDSNAIIFADLICSASHLVPLALEAYNQQAFENLAYFEPLYLKPPNITKAKKVI